MDLDFRFHIFGNVNGKKLKKIPMEPVDSMGKGGVVASYRILVFDFQAG